MESSPQELWSQCLNYIKDNISKESYRTWFNPIEFVSYSNQVLLIKVPSQFVYEYLEVHYIKELKSGINRFFGDHVQLRYRVETDKTNQLSTDISTSNCSTIVSDKPYKDANKTPDIFSGLVGRYPQELDPHLNPYYTFDNFIEGDSNKLPRTIGLTIADKPEQDTFNPFFIYGESGVGKSHLVNAIGTRIKENNPLKRILYVSAHLLQIQYTDSIRNNKFNDFMNFYQSIDILIIDDIQEIAGKEKTQEAFFNIFNHLQHNHRQLIITCDRPPVLLEGIQERLLTRFKWGIVSELERPNAKLRKDIVQNRVMKDGLQFPQNVINYIATNVTGNIRDLEGVVNSIMAYSVVYNCDVNLDLAERTISHSVKLSSREVTIDSILDNVCNYYHVSNKEVFSASRKHNIVEVRQISMYLSQKHTNLSSSQIGSKIGKRDHSTVLHSCNLMEKRISVDKSFRLEIEKLERQIVQNKK